MIDDLTSQSNPDLGDYLKEWSPEEYCKVETGYGWEKYVTHAIGDLLELGFRLTHLWSSNGELHLKGEGVITPRVAKLLADKAQLLSQRCEHCWLGGPTKAVNGRCEYHKEYAPGYMDTKFISTNLDTWK